MKEIFSTILDFTLKNTAIDLETKSTDNTRIIIVQHLDAIPDTLMII